MPASRNSKPQPISAFSLVLLAAAALSVLAVWFFRSRGELAAYGDAEAHLDIARRIVDSRTPGWRQMGAPWLPVPHLLMLPFVSVTAWWQSGIAGSIANSACFVAAAGFLFAVLRRLFGTAGALAGTAVVVLNPNALYLQAIAMTEPVFLCELTALLYFTLRRAPWAAGCVAALATLTRYEGWFLLPFCAVYFLLGPHRWKNAAAFSAVAALGPLLWFVYNYWLYRSPFWFFNGPYSAKAIQGDAYYPGKNDWTTAIHYFFTNARLVVGPVLLWAGLAGAVLAAGRRRRWALLLFSLPPLFYIWSMHSSGLPIFIPKLWPHGIYNTRYGLSMLPPVALGIALLTSRVRCLGVAALVFALAPWIWHPSPREWITWQESDRNWEARRTASRRLAAWLSPRVRPADTFLTDFDPVLTGTYRELGIPLIRTLTGDNGPAYIAATVRPDLYLYETWVIGFQGDEVDRTARRANLPLELMIPVEGARIIRVYRR